MSASFFRLPSRALVSAAIRATPRSVAPVHNVALDSRAPAVSEMSPTRLITPGPEFGPSRRSGMVAGALGVLSSNNPAMSGTIGTRMSVRALSTTPVSASAVDPSLAAGPAGEFVQAVVTKGDAALAGSSYWNVQAMQNLIETICINADVPWVAGIAATTLLLRLCLFPVVTWTMKNNVKLMNLMPESKIHQERMQACKERGDNAGMAEATKQLMDLYQKNGVHPLRGFVGMFIQAPVFMTMFFSLRGLASADPAISSLQAGGGFWFSDLTAADPYLVLPVFSCLSMVALIEVGADGAQTGPAFKMFFRALSVFVLGFTYDFPAAVFVYWGTNNALSLTQTLLLKTGPVRSLVGIPAQIKHNVKPPGQQSDFSFSKLIENAKANMEGDNQNQMKSAESARAAAIQKLRESRARRKTKKRR